jgi:polysaccharide biosynthesis protein PelF
MAHICLILEGTYPFITGGVSNWVHMLVSGIPEHDFSIAHIYTGLEPVQAKYKLPGNIKNIHKIPLTVTEQHSNMKIAVNGAPQADVYHALSTGFAGLLAVEIKQKNNRPFILTEHGIYWHEIELGVDEVECGFKIIQINDGKLSLGRTWESWLDTFKHFAREAYIKADEITTVCQSNQEKQLQLDADKNKCSVINNGVDVKKFKNALIKTKPNIPTNIGLIGRVTSIKDVETYISACSIVKEKMSEAKFYVIGPVDHDEKYFNKCQQLVNEFGLTDFIFTGEVETAEYLKKLDIVVLTSKSEGLPFVLLESMAAGVPVVATDVGGCRDVVMGNGDKIGDAGLICSVADAPGIAGAIFELCTNSKLWYACSDAGKKKVAESYRKEFFLDQYRLLYSKYLKSA